jgi:hypothetical protein
VIPNAKDYVASLQSKFKEKEFKDLDAYGQVEQYKQILATRASVSAVRGSFRGKALDRPLDCSRYEDALEQMSGDMSAADDALLGLIQKHGQDKVLGWARDGHGGLLEDKVKAELREMAMNGSCRLGAVPEQLRPTVGERLSDIKSVLKDNDKWNALEDSEKKFLLSEYALLQKDARLPGGMNAILGDIDEHNETAKKFAESERFNQSVPSVENMRLNLAHMELNQVVDEFNRSQIEKIRQEQLQAKQGPEEAEIQAGGGGGPAAGPRIHD